MLVLIANPQIDEVLILISNRSRLLPDAFQALDARSSALAWEILLHELPLNNKPVRVTIARRTAIDACRDYVYRASTEKTILLCQGEADYIQGDRRFESLIEMFPNKNVSINVLPTLTYQLRATTLRKYLSEGEASRELFCKAFADHLSTHTTSKLWWVCIKSLFSIHTIRESRLADILSDLDIDFDKGFYPADPENVASRYCARRLNGETLWIHYIGDELENSDPWTPKERVTTANRALKRFVGADIGLTIPDLVKFDPTTRTLVHTEIMPGGQNLELALTNSITRGTIAKNFGSGLANLHNLPVKPSYLRGSKNREQQWWNLHSQILQKIPGIAAQTVFNESQQACQRINMLYLISPEFYRVSGTSVGITDLTHCSSTGDPAFDIAFALYQFRNQKPDSCGAENLCSSEFLSAYQATTNCDDARIKRAQNIAALIHRTPVSCAANR